MFAIVLFCLGCLLVSAEKACAQPVPNMPKYGSGTITEFKRFVDGVEWHEYEPGQTIWITAKSRVKNDRPDVVTFVLNGFIWNSDSGHDEFMQIAAYDSSSVDVAPTPPGDEPPIVDGPEINTNKEGKYVTPLQLCPKSFDTAASLGSSMNGIAGKKLDTFPSTFKRSDIQ
ncbi:MAG: hypothetical protein KF851_19770 [Pirellulaceae bacterium]|nr:hypothetical protein [Pirellulaceae bacterium]